jgi:hypothetical protein
MRRFADSVFAADICDPRRIGSTGAVPFKTLLTKSIQPYGGSPLK